MWLVTKNVNSDSERVSEGTLKENMNFVLMTIGPSLRNDPSVARPKIVNPATALPTGSFWSQRRTSDNSKPVTTTMKIVARSKTCIN